MPRGRKPKSLLNAIKTPAEIDEEIAAVKAEITELRGKLAKLKKARVAALAAKEQEDLKLLGDKIRESGKTIEEWLEELG